MPRREKSKRSRMVWTSIMISDLLWCKKEAIRITKGENPPRKSNGRKIGYMEYMHNLWNQKNYSYLGLTPQNLRDEAVQAERKHESYQTSLTNTILDDRVNANYDVNIEEVSDNIPEIVSDTFTVDNELLNGVIKESETIFNNIRDNVGDFSNRTFTTRFKSNPSVDDIGVINSVCKTLIQKHELLLLENKLLVLWLINCVVYAAITGFVVVKNLRGLNISSKTVVVNSKKCRVPYDVYQIDEEIKKARKLLSQVCAERSRIQNNGRMTRRTKRNRVVILKHCDEGVISIYSITCLIEKLKKKVTFLSKKRKSKLKSRKIRQLNKEFDKDQKNVFGKFKKSIEQDPDNLTPVFKECRTERKYFEDTTKVEKFWKNLWELEDVGRPKAVWLDEIRKIFEEIVPEISKEDIKFDSVVCFKAIRKKKNWSAPGPDYIANFWWKKLSAVLDITTQTFHSLINVVGGIEQWFCRGRTSLLPKDGEWAEDNQRPITCLNTQYKWLTSLLLYFHNLHLDKYQLMQIDQRGAKQKVSGTVDNTLIDDMILRDAILHRRNLFGFWVDVKKAFDSVSHSWLLEMFIIHRFPVKLVDIITNIICNWSVIINIPVEGGIKESGVIKFLNGILQGDSYCPALYTLSKNVISWLVRSFEGYTVAKPISIKFTHTLFIDDLKGYAKTRARLEFCLNKVSKAMKEAGLFWNPKKCRFFEISKGIHKIPDDITLEDGTIVKSIKEDETYKFMGVPQSYKNEVGILEDKLLKLVKQRAYIIWKSDLYDVNKVYASNIFINSAIEYFFWSLKFTLKFLKDADLAIRNAMNVSGAKHTNLMNSVVYLPRVKGGRGLKSLEQSYKEIKVKVAAKLINTEDKRLVVVKQFHRYYFDKPNYSIFKEANNYVKDMGLDFEIVKRGSDIYFRNEVEDEKIEKEEKQLGAEIIKKKTEANVEQIVESNWQGLNLKTRMDDDSIIKNYFTWLKNWKSCPTNVIAEFFNLFYQTLPTLCYKQGRYGCDIDDTTCRLCSEHQESVRHLMSNCPAFLNTVYKSRHDNALKCFVFPLLKKLGLRNKETTWYSLDKVKPYYENDSAKFWWDVPEYTGREDSKDQKTKPLRPDGKLELISENEHKILLIEMSVPWMINRATKLKEKVDKYEHIRNGYRLVSPNYIVDQVTLIMDVFGGYDKSLTDNIGKVIKDKSLVDFIIKNMQKSIISSCAYLSRAFKVRTM